MRYLIGDMDSYMIKLRKLKNNILKTIFFIGYISYLVQLRLNSRFKDTKFREALSLGQMEKFMGFIWLIFWSSLFLLTIRKNPSLVINPYLLFCGVLILIFSNFLLISEKNYLPFFREFKKSVVKINFCFALFFIFNIVILVSYIALINSFIK